MVGARRTGSWSSAWRCSGAATGASSSTAPRAVNGFEGRYREVTAPERLVQTFEWDGMPGYVAIETTTFEELGEGRTRVVTVTLFHTVEERDGMLEHRHGGGPQRRATPRWTRLLAAPE